MLEKMLVGVLGLSMAQTFVTNAVKCLPPAALEPSAAELAACGPVLQAQLAVVRPDVVLVMGDVATRALFNDSAGAAAARGVWRTLDVAGRKVPAMTTFHPAHLRARPADKRLVFGDLKLVRARLDESRR
jgi:uracil-DNA glycosylase